MNDASPSRSPQPFCAGKPHEYHGYTVELVSDLAALQPDWEALHADDPYAGLFLSYAWIKALYQKTGTAAHVYTVRDVSGALLCLFPAYLSHYTSRSTGRAKTAIKAAGRLSLSEYTGFVCAPDHEANALQALANFLMSQSWDRLSLRYEPTGRRAAIFADAFPAAQFRSRWPEYKINDGATDCLICPVVDLPADFETFLSQKIGRRSRKNMRSAQRKFIETGEMQIRHSTPEQIKRGMSALFGLWSAQWAGQLKPARITSLLRRYQRYFELAAQQDALLLSLIWRGEQVLAAQAAIIDVADGRLICKMSGRDVAQAASVGKLLDLAQIKWAIEHGFALFDFGHGNAAYKYSFGARDQPIRILSIRRRSRA